MGYKDHTGAVTALRIRSMYIEYMFLHVYVFLIQSFILLLHVEICLIFALYVQDFPH